MRVGMDTFDGIQGEAILYCSHQVLDTHGQSASSNVLTEWEAEIPRRRVRNVFLDANEASKDGEESDANKALKRTIHARFGKA